jgi:hypothetical protein
MTHNDLRYEFGPYQLNPSKCILTRDGEGIPLTPKATDLSQNIFTLRRALRDDRIGPKYIETIARRVGKEVRANAGLVGNMDARKKRDCSQCRIGGCRRRLAARAVRTLELTDG